MTRLTSRQRAHLRALAHHLEPVAHTGVEGLTEAALRSILEGIHVAQTIRPTLVLYRRHPEKPEIRLPEG